MLAYCKLDHYEETLVKFESKYSNFRTRKSFEDVCKLAAISSQPQSLLMNMTLVNLWAISYNLLLGLVTFKMIRRNEKMTKYAKVIVNEQKPFSLSDLSY